MTVQELIEKLESIEDKSRNVVIFGEFDGKLNNMYGQAVSRNEVGQVIDFQDDTCVGITRVI